LLATVSAVDPIYVNFQMNEKAFLSIMRWVTENRDKLKEKRGLEDNKSLPVYLALSDNKMYPYPGTIDFVGREIDPATGTIALRAEFPNKDGLIKPGSFAEVTLILGEEENGIVVPQSCIQPIQDKNFVFVVDSANTIKRVPVNLGQHIDNLVVINDGLQPGDRILIEGYQKIREGMSIIPITVKDTITVPAPGK
ncbi:MAG: efflux RND transporter periplasmic adaptor subunit, partial [Bacteroidia bacterium]|nr:efflux RND transporter periplasmic adaptor subunit [Bacteroidia bacterium]